MAYSLKEVPYSDLTDLMREAMDSQGLLPLTEDVQPFLQVLPELFQSHPDYHPFLFLENETQPVGFIVALPHREPGTLSIGPMYISRQYRGQGLGYRLVEALIQWAKTYGIAFLSTQTWGRNAPSRRIFEKLGFECVGEQPNTRVDTDGTVRYLLRIEA